MGVGSAKNYKQVKWITSRKIFLAWILTIPVAITFGAICSLLLGLIK
jgi:phosphate/sulfate permease